MNLQPLLDGLQQGHLPSFDDLSADDWEQLARAVRFGAVPLEVQAALASAIGGHEAGRDVLIELVTDNGVALAISRALLSEDSIADLKHLLEESGLARAMELDGPHERLVVPLARLLADPRAWWWLARGLFHTSVLAVLPELVRDTDAPIRIAAVDALAATPGDKSVQALFTALHDTSGDVRKAAYAALKERCEDDALKERLAVEVRDLDALVEQASGAGSAYTAYFERVPGLSGVVGALRQNLATDKATERRNLLAGLRKRFRLYRGREDSTAYVALAIAMAWADGNIREYEAATLDRLVSEHLGDADRSTVSALIENRPSPDQLAPFLAKLRDPKAVAQALRADFDLDGEAARRWLAEVAAAAELDADLLIEA